MSRTPLSPFERDAGLGQPPLRIPASGGGPLDYDLLAKSIANNLAGLSAATIMTRGLISRVVTIQTTPVVVITAQFLRGYVLLNPASTLASGVTAKGTLVASRTITGAGNSQATSLGVANYSKGYLYLNVSAYGAQTTNFRLWTQSLDPTTLAWTDGQVAFDRITATGEYVAYIGEEGLATDLAVRWEVTGAAPSVTFSVGYVLKEGLPGSSTGISRTVYLGGPGVTTTSGFPLLEGQSWPIFLRENVLLYGVGLQALNLNVFEL